MFISADIFELVIKIFILAMAIFYSAFSVLLVQKARYMCQTLINEMGRILVIFCWVNFILAVVLTVAFLFS